NATNSPTFCGTYTASPRSSNLDQLLEMSCTPQDVRFPFGRYHACSVRLAAWRADEVRSLWSEDSRLDSDPPRPPRGKSGAVQNCRELASDHNPTEIRNKSLSKNHPVGWLAARTDGAAAVPSSPTKGPTSAALRLRR